jgi:hypothetical protein
VFHAKLSVGDTVKFKVEAVSYIVNTIIILGSEDIEQSAITSNPKLQAQAGAKTAKPAQAANTRDKITEYLPTRRSERKPKAELLKEQMEEIEARLLANLGIEVTIIQHKGRGIKTVREFSKGQFVVT